MALQKALSSVFVYNSPLKFRYSSVAGFGDGASKEVIRSSEVVRVGPDLIRSVRSVSLQEETPESQLFPHKHGGKAMQEGGCI